MGWFTNLKNRFAGNASPALSRAPIPDAAVTHLQNFAASRRGVEVYLEPQTMSSAPSVLLIAYDGEWTRRTVPSAIWGRKFAEHLQLPVYDAAVVGYPQRMRDYNSSRSRSKRRGSTNLPSQ